ncbi:mobile genetic element [Streptococcus pneumoniae]|nr:mobile genetic element [Streptococcus pneumoniae]
MDITVNYCHDMKLFKMSRRNIGKTYNHALSKERSKVENIFAKVKTFKMISTTYRNHRKRFGLRMNLIAGIINHELGF